MTFYEAALRVLEEAGKPLSHLEITKVAVEKNLLSHVGKLPETTMLARLAAMAKRPRDRKVIVTAKDTFALTDWMLTEDAAALAATGVPEVNPEADMPPYRPAERHPEASPSFARSLGRQGDREHKRRRDRDDDRRRKYPPIAEVAFELLSESETKSLTPQALLEAGRAKEVCSNELSLNQLLNALIDDNQRRIDAGRRPQFGYLKPDDGEAILALDESTETPPQEIQEAFCKLANVPFENGRAVLRGRDRGGEREAPQLSGEDQELVQTAKSAVKDAKRALARVFRRRLADLEAGTFEKACVRLMHGLGYRELKVAKRSKDGPLLTARKRDGSLELRVAARLLKGNQGVERRHVSELRRDLHHYGANMGLICSTGDARGDAKSEALGNGAMIMLWCGEGLADKFFEAHVGVEVQTFELYEIDEGFFEKAKTDADAAAQRREERHKERDERGDRGERGERGERDGRREEPTSPIGEAHEERAESPPSAEGGEAPPAEAQSQGEGGFDDGDDGGDSDGDDEGGDEGMEAEGAPHPSQPGQPGQPGAGGPGGERRRRRRRRRRRGRGPRPEGAPGQPGQPGQQAQGEQGGGAPDAGGGGGGAPASAPPPPPPPAPAGGGSGSEGG